MNPSASFQQGNWMPSQPGPTAGFDRGHMAGGMNQHLPPMLNHMGHHSPHAFGAMSASQTRVNGGMPQNPQHMTSMNQLSPHPMGLPNQQVAGGMVPSQQRMMQSQSGVLPPNPQHAIGAMMANQHHGVTMPDQQQVGGMVMSSQSHMAPGTMSSQAHVTNGLTSVQPNVANGMMSNQQTVEGGLRSNPMYAASTMGHNPIPGPTYPTTAVSTSMPSPFYASSIPTTAMMTASAPVPAFQNLTTLPSPIVSTSNWASCMKASTAPNANQQRLTNQSSTQNTASADLRQLSCQSATNTQEPGSCMATITPPKTPNAPLDRHPGNMPPSGYLSANPARPTSNPLQSPQRDTKPAIPPPPLVPTSQVLQYPEARMHEPNLNLLSRMRPDIRPHQPTSHPPTSHPQHPPYPANSFENMVDKQNRANISSSQRMPSTMPSGQQWQGPWPEQGTLQRNSGVIVNNSNSASVKRPNESTTSSQAKRPATGEHRNDYNSNHIGISPPRPGVNVAQSLPHPMNARQPNPSQGMHIELGPLFEILVLNIQPNQLERPLLHNTVVRWLCNKCGPVMDVTHKNNPGHLVLPCRMLPENVLPYRCETCPAGSGTFRIFEQFIHHLRRHQKQQDAGSAMVPQMRAPAPPARPQHMANSQMLQHMAQMSSSVPASAANGMMPVPRQRGAMPERPPWPGAMNGMGSLPGSANIPQMRMAMDQRSNTSSVPQNHKGRSPAQTKSSKSTDRNQSRQQGTKSTHSSGSQMRSAPGQPLPQTTATFSSTGHSNNQDVSNRLQPLVPNQSSSGVVDFSNVLNIVPLHDAAEVPDAFVNRANLCNLGQPQMTEQRPQRPAPVIVKPEKDNPPRRRMDLHVDLTDTAKSTSSSTPVTETPRNSAPVAAVSAATPSVRRGSEGDVLRPQMIKAEARSRRHVSLHVNLEDDNEDSQTILAPAIGVQPLLGDNNVVRPVTVTDANTSSTAAIHRDTGVPVLGDQQPSVTITPNVPVVADKQTHVSAAADKETSVPVVADTPTSVPVVADKPSSVPVVADKPSVPVVADKPSMPVVAEKPSSAPVVAEKPSSAPVVADKPSSVPVVADKPNVPVVADKPSMPVVAEKPSSAPVVADKPSSVPVVADKPSVPVVADKPSMPVVAEKQSSAPVVAEKPSSAPVVADKPSSVPTVADNPASVSIIAEKQPTVTYVPSIITANNTCVPVAAVVSATSVQTATGAKSSRAGNRSPAAHRAGNKSPGVQTRAGNKSPGVQTRARSKSPGVSSAPVTNNTKIPTTVVDKHITMTSPIADKNTNVSQANETRDVSNEAALPVSDATNKKKNKRKAKSVVSVQTDLSVSTKTSQVTVANTTKQAPPESPALTIGVDAEGSNKVPFIPTGNSTPEKKSGSEEVAVYDGVRVPQRTETVGDLSGKRVQQGGPAKEADKLSDLLDYQEPESPCPLALVMNFADSLPPTPAATPAPIDLRLGDSALDLSKSTKTSAASQRFDTGRMFLDTPSGNSNPEFTDMEFSSRTTKTSTFENDPSISKGSKDRATNDVIRSVEEFVAGEDPPSPKPGTSQSEPTIDKKDTDEDLLTQFLNEDSSSFHPGGLGDKTTTASIANPSFFNLADLYSESDSSSNASTNSCPSTLAYGLSSPESTPTHVNEQPQPVLTSPPPPIQLPDKQSTSDVEDEVVRPSSGHSGHRTPDSGHVTSDSVSEHSVGETPEHFRCTCPTKQPRPSRKRLEVIEISDDEEPTISMEPDVIPWDT